MGRGLRCAFVLAAIWAGCGEATQTVRVEPGPDASPAGQPPNSPSNGPDSSGSRDGGAPLNPSDAPSAIAPVRPLPAQLGPEPGWQPGFHQALRWSRSLDGTQTFRFKVPVARAGQRVRVAFAAGDGAGVIQRATVARAGAASELASEPIPLTFRGAAQAQLSARERVVSDPVELTVQPLEELYVSFEGAGSFAASAIDAFPDSWVVPSTRAFDQKLSGASPHPTLVGVNTVDVEGAPAPVFVAIGDSITEGYISGRDDTRNAWPLQTTKRTGLTFVNGAVSGQGIWSATDRLAREVLVLESVTDCVVLLGTNDLAAHPSAELEERLDALFDGLRPFCRIWAGTLVPKERTTQGDLAQVNARRRAVNAWLRDQADVHGVIDFAQALAMPGDVDSFAPGLDEDGIHPSLEGHQLMADWAARALAP